MCHNIIRSNGDCQKIISFGQRVGHGSLQMSFDMSPHRVTALMGDPARRTTGSMERAPVCRNARNPLHNRVPWNMGCGCDNWRVRGVHNHKVTVVGLTCEAGDAQGVEHILRSGHVSPAFRCIPIIETLVKAVECTETGYNSQSSRHSP